MNSLKYQTTEFLYLVVNVRLCYYLTLEIQWNLPHVITTGMDETTYEGGYWTKRGVIFFIYKICLINVSCHIVLLKKLMLNREFISGAY